MHRLGLFTICIFYILLSYTTARSSAISVTAPPSITPAILAKTSASLASDTDPDSTSHTTSRGTHVPHIPSHISSFTFSHRPWTQPPATPTTSSPPQSSQTHHPIETMAIVGIIFGAIAGLVLVLSVARCWWSWRKTPSRDRIAALMHRYNLEREMEEAVVEPLRARVRRPPPPPYRPPPPGYEHIMPSSPPPAHLERPTSVPVEV